MLVRLGIPNMLPILYEHFCNKFTMFSIFLTVSLDICCRKCSTHSCSTTLGEHDHGHFGSISISNWTTKWWLNAKDTSRKEWEIHHQYNVEKHLGTINLPVYYHMVSPDTRKRVIWAQWPWCWSYTQHNYIQFLCFLPGKLSLNRHFMTIIHELYDDM